MTDVYVSYAQTSAHITKNSYTHSHVYICVYTYTRICAYTHTHTFYMKNHTYTTYNTYKVVTGCIFSHVFFSLYKYK